jgi:hypothetical protein
MSETPNIEEAVQALERAKRRNAVLIPLMREGGHETVGDLLQAMLASATPEQAAAIAQLLGQGDPR